MTTNRTGAMQLVRYTPNGPRLGVLPVHGLTHVSGPNGGVLTFLISETLYGELPAEVEVAVESWHGAGFVEERDGRFSLNSQNADKADVAGMVQITAQALVPWQGEAAYLSAVDPFRMDDLVVIGPATLTGVSSSGSTLTMANHGMVGGDRVRILEIGKMSTKAVASGGVYYIRNITTNTFQLSSTLTGDIVKAVGTSSGDVKLERLRDQVAAPGHPFKNGDKVRVAYADGSGLADGQSYFLVRDGGTHFGFASEPGGTPIELNSNNLGVYRDLDGERVFKGTQATPGFIVQTAFSEAVARGWAGGALSEDFSGTADSSGAAWVDLLEGEAGLPIGFRPGTSLTAILNFMVENQYAEFATVGRTLRLWNYGFGVDRSLGNMPVTVGLNATAKPEKRDLNSLASHVRVRGGGRVQVDVNGTPGAFGRREMYVAAAGVTSDKLAKSIGSQKLKVAKVLTQNAVTESAAEVRWLAGRDYFRGDYLLALVKRNSGVPERYRVVEIQKSMNEKGDVQITTVFGDRIVTSPLARLAAKARQSSGGISAGGNGGPLLTSDSRKPAAPVLASVESTGVFTGSGAPASTIVASWAGVTVDIDGLDIYVTQYEMWLRADGKVKGYPASTTGGLMASAEVGAPGQTFLVSVRAQSSTGVWGPFSEEKEVETAAPVEPPNPPTAPGPITSQKGVVRIPWDGMLVDPVAGPEVPRLGFRNVYAVRGSSEVGTYERVGYVLGHAGFITDSTAEVGQTYWYKLHAESTVGVVSAPSPAVSHTVVGVSEADLAPSTLAVLQSANGKNKTTFSFTDPPSPDPDAATRQVGDLWYKRHATTTATIGIWRWNGSGWTVLTLDNAVLGGLDVGKLVAGSAVIDTAVIAKLAADLFTAGRIQSEHLNVGAVVPKGTPNQRVPAPVTDPSWWNEGGGIANVVGQTHVNENSHVTASTAGLSFSPTATERAIVGITALNAVPTSRALNVTWAATAPVNIAFRWVDAAGVTSWSGALFSAATGSQVIRVPDTAVQYGVLIQVDPGAAAATVTLASVMEVIGAGAITGAQRTEISNVGLRLFNDDGSPAVDLTTVSKNFLSFFDNGQVTATIDETGVFTGPSARVEDVEIGGVPLVGNFLDAQRNGDPYEQPTVLERLGRGVIYDAYWASMDAVVVSTQYKRIATGNFTPEPGRQYMLFVDLGGLQVVNSSGVNIYVELQMSYTPFTALNDGANWGRSVVHNTNRGYFSLDPIPFRTSPTDNIESHTVTNGAKIYWQLNLNLLSAPTSSYTLNQYGLTNGLTVVDIGPAIDPVLTTDRSSSGGAAVPAATSTTKEFAVDWSRSWNNSGSGIVSGSGTFTDANMLYQGFGASPMGSRFAFNHAATTSGKAISSAYLWLKNRHTYKPDGVTARLGSTNGTSPPATFGSRTDAWDVSWGRGVGKWIKIPPSLYPELASGAIDGFSLGVSGSAAEYAYFDGKGKSSPPKLKITYK